MIPNVVELSHIIADENGESAFVTCEGIAGYLYELPCIDLEANEEQRISGISQVLHALEPNTTLKILVDVNNRYDGLGEHPRSEAIKEQGYIEEKITVAFEASQKEPSIVGLVSSLLHNKHKKDHVRVDRPARAMLQEIRAVPLAEDAIRRWFQPYSAEITSKGSLVDMGGHVCGVVRLWKPGNDQISCEQIAEVKRRLRAPFRLAVSVRRIDDVDAQKRLLLQSKRREGSGNEVSARICEANTSAASDAFLLGSKLYSIDWTVQIIRKNEAELRTDLIDTKRSLGRLGETCIEAFNVLSSIETGRIGAASQKVPFLALSDAIAGYLPIYSVGEDTRAAHSERALFLHRDNQSPHFFDLFDPRFSSGNAVVNGGMGSGKSVLSNLVSQAMLADPNVYLIKIDVGGSYRKECELLGGEEIDFKLDEACGLNPFAALADTLASKDATQALTQFLSALSRSSDEHQTPKDITIALEEAISDFVKKVQPPYTLDRFLEHHPDLPRISYLRRWATGGIFENVLKPRPISKTRERFRYYNFDSIAHAGNEDFAQGVMAAVIADVNLEIIRSGDARSGSGKKLVLFVDECPFFVRKNGAFFKFTVLNFRKFGHATYFIAQSFADLEFINERGVRDTSIVDLSQTRIFYRQEGTQAEGCARFGISPAQYERLGHLNKTREYRDFLLQDPIGARFVRLTVSAEELWQTTSTRDHNTKLYSLLAAVPGLTMREAIKCLAITT
jgi:hypothetical protein